eukprot:COSAG01_NODE_72606_length_252_cov_1.150327_1_plen_45_part_10
MHFPPVPHETLVGAVQPSIFAQHADILRPVVPKGFAVYPLLGHNM